MARFFVTGSSDGLGSLTAQKLIAGGHQVVLHARNAQRAKDAEAACPGSQAVLIADLSSIEETKQLAAEANKLGPFDAVVHNAGVMGNSTKGKSGLPSIFAVNTLAPYILTCLMDKPKRLAFISSNMHRGGSAKLDDLMMTTYSDSKLHDIMLANAFARRWPDVESNSADPGWVPTKMGGRGATGDINLAVDTFVMLALGEGAAKGQTGKYFVGLKENQVIKDANDVGLQDRLLKELAKISGVEVPK
ncbi:hypothetical protein F5884DRAFT_764727 [Xylogone sp. PMI_703]|nr:hypothetical protein F5884DRAFT_764727 [Xylogone sp. PMI_703]